MWVLGRWLCIVGFLVCSLCYILCDVCCVWSVAAVFCLVFDVSWGVRCQLCAACWWLCVADWSLCCVCRLLFADCGMMFDMRCVLFLFSVCVLFGVC